MITSAAVWYGKKVQDLNQYSILSKMLCSTTSPAQCAWTVTGNSLRVNPHVQNKNILKRYCWGL